MAGDIRLERRVTMPNDDRRPLRCPRTSRAAVLLALLGALAPPADAADWASLGVDGDRNRYSVDDGSTRRDGSRVTARVRTEYATPRDDAGAGMEVYAAIDTLVFDCTAASFALAARSLVAADLLETQTIANAREDLRFRPVAAGSMSERILRHVCGEPPP